MRINTTLNKTNLLFSAGPPQSVDNVVEGLCNEMLENPSYPRRASQKKDTLQKTHHVVSSSDSVYDGMSVQ